MEKQTYLPLAKAIAERQKNTAGESSTATGPATIQIDRTESEAISIEEVQVEPKSNAPTTILPNNQVAPVVTTQPQKTEDSDDDFSSGSSSEASDEDSEEESDEGKCAPSECCKKRTCGGWACCILIWFFKIIGFILWIALIALGGKGGRKKRRRGKRRGKAGNRYGHHRGMNFGGRRR